MAALLVAACGVLAFGQVFRQVIDSGLSSISPEALDAALGLFLLVVLIFSSAVLTRSYLLNWLGERVVAGSAQGGVQPAALRA